MKPLVDVSIEATAKKAFATAIDWPGWSRSGKTQAMAIDALAAYAGRFALVATIAGEALPATKGLGFEVVERSAGGGATEYGVPSNVTEHDRRPTNADDAARLCRLVDAAWRTFASIAEAAPEELRKGPRGGGRDTAKVIEHVLGSEQSYALNLGIKIRPFEADDRQALESMRAAMLDALSRPSDGSPVADRPWTVRYAAHRIAWHALDHAWEIEDRTEQEPETGARSS